MERMANDVSTMNWRTTGNYELYIYFVIQPRDML